ncbi:MAG: tryptophan--tRNA ligase [Ignavibacteria bacterium]|jgi:tryptophanyl-tRNA synthetase|nr:tryptophan--tRNA ligase [Ignavibacteria bacterium]
MENNQKIILSGIQPSGNLTIGHLAGALTNWQQLQDDYQCFYMIADLHTMTIRQEPSVLRDKTMDTIAMYVACGISPEKSTLFVQSHVPAHSQLQWILSCFTGYSECAKMTQFKDKSQAHSDNINVGLFAYPVLMAADILLYQADLVPIGDDQKQHLELTRNVAQRFNYHYSDTFKIPEPFIPKIGARIMSLQEPTKKMSKSDENEKNIIFLTDSDDQIRNKIKRSVTDSGTEIKCADNKPGITNLLTLLSVSTGNSLINIENNFIGKTYGDLKNTTADAIIEFIKPIRNEYEKIKLDKNYLNNIIKDGMEKANKTAFKTLCKVYKKIGLVQL